MTQVLIVVDALSAATTQMVLALKHAIHVDPVSSLAITGIKVVSTADPGVDDTIEDDCIFCPLTFHPSSLTFHPSPLTPHPSPLTLSGTQALYATCRDVAGLRKQLDAWDYATGTGAFWLPIVLTAKGALYGEVIGLEKDAVVQSSTSEPSYTQPVHLSDRQRQPLYALGQRLLRSLNASPAVYLMQFGWHDGAVCFDRLFPFPAAPAIASINVQTPDLFACHWACLTGKPLLDLTIV